ncbi:MAG: tRNA lysidine(34) synthetase TilS [Pseudomonadota bacterium]
MSLTDAQVAAVWERLDATRGKVGLAVSGGGDSLALAVLAGDWAKARGRKLLAITVDHGLRPESAAEAESVAAFCREFAIPHEIAVWEEWSGEGNLQDAARRARQRLIAEVARENGIDHVCTGHTLDDQAETFLMRLARGSGVDGLSGISPVRSIEGLMWHRPLIEIRRNALRDYLTVEGLPWIDDPTNEDETFERVKARRLLSQLAELGIDAKGLADTAFRMARARRALEAETARLAGRAAKLDQCDVLLDWPAIQSAPEEIRLRLLAHALSWISSEPYRPRASALANAVSALDAGRTTALQGCLLIAQGSQRRITREFRQVSALITASDETWDRRWRFNGPHAPQFCIRALGEDGLRACPDWRDGGLPRQSAKATPGVWEGNRLVAAPLAGFSNGWASVPLRSPESFASSVISD